MTISEAAFSVAQLGFLEVSEKGQHALLDQFRKPVDYAVLKASMNLGESSLGEFLNSQDVAPVSIHGDTAVITISGPLEYRMSLMGYFYGYASYTAVRRSIEEALDNSKISQVVLDIDSPGGQTVGNIELCRWILSQRGNGKPIYAFANPDAASAALKISVACSKFYTLGSGYVGSIGTMAHAYSFAEALKNEGVDYKVITSPDAKGEDWPQREMTPERIEHWTSTVSEMSNEFHEFVADARGVSIEHVRENFGGGRVIRGTQAVAVGLCDEVKTVEEFLGENSGGGNGKRKDGGLTMSANRKRDRV